MYKFAVCVLILVNIGCLVQSSAILRRTRETSSCTSEYQALNNSVMCLSPSSDYTPGSAGVSDADIDEILQVHNKFRKDVNPTASAMQKMYWDDELAILAEQWAKQCVVGHDSQKGYSRYPPAYGMSPGQNGGFGYSNWTNVITDGWHSEVEDFTYGNATDAVVGHYTQVVKDTAIRIGCGYAKCDSPYQHFYFCNYLTGFQNEINYFSILDKIVTPYELGESCSGCEGQCVDEKLCDCGGTFCYNGGTMDLTTCGCTCPSPFIGSMCLERACGGKTCLNGGTLNIDTCACSCSSLYIGETCETRACDGKTCLNGGTLDVDTCTCSCTKLYSGDTCETTNCPAKDPWYCETEWPPAYCTKYSNVPDHCPIMCKTC